MKIAYFHGTTVPSRAASTVNVMKMCEAFACLGHEVILFVPEGSDLNLSSVDIHQIYGVQKNFKIIHYNWFRGKHNWFYFPGLGYFSALHLAFKIKLLGINLVYSRFALAGLIAAFVGVRVIHESHRPLSQLEPREARITRLLLRNSRTIRVVMISDALKQMYLSVLPQIKNKCLVAHDAANITNKTYKTISVNKKLTVGYVGSIIPGRGIELIISIAHECSFAEFHIIGGSYQEISQYRIEVSKLSNLHMHGYQPNSIAIKMLEEFDVVLAPYGSKVSVHGDANADTSEFMSPLKLFEYMAAGKAIICSDHAVLQEVILHEETALICKREKVSEWVNALYRLWQDPSLRLNLGRQAYEVCKNNYTWHIRAKNVLNFIKMDV